MRPCDIDCIEPAQFPTALPLTLKQRTSRTSAVFFLGLLVPAVVTMLVPLLTLAAAAYAEPATRAVFAERPFATAITGAGLLIWLGLWTYPLRRYWGRLTRSRRIAIDATGRVAVAETSALRRRAWVADIGDFKGVQHTVRSSLSGTRHELSLIHPEPKKSLILHLAPTITDQQTATMAALLQSRLLGKVGSTDAGRDARAVRPVNQVEPETLAA